MSLAPLPPVFKIVSYMSGYSIVQSISVDYE